MRVRACHLQMLTLLECAVIKAMDMKPLCGKVGTFEGDYVRTKILCGLSLSELRNLGELCDISLSQAEHDDVLLLIGRLNSIPSASPYSVILDEALEELSGNFAASVFRRLPLGNALENDSEAPAAVSAVQAPMQQIVSVATAALEPCKSKIKWDTCDCNENKLCDSQCAVDQGEYSLGIGMCDYKREGTRSPALEARYLSLVKKTVTGAMYGSWPGMIDGSEWTTDYGNACTMIGLRRLDNMQFLLEEVIRLNLPGDFIETGVWRGGASILAASVFAAYGQTCPGPFSRKIFVVDSFEGIPPEGPEDSSHAGAGGSANLRHNAPEKVKARFAAFNLMSETVIFLPGYSLPAARPQFTQFAVVRLDGDTYESTIQSLDNLYDKLVVGGFVIVDDYIESADCRKAVTDFRRNQRIDTPLKPVYHAPHETARGAWWQKRA